MVANKETPYKGFAGNGFVALALLLVSFVASVLLILNYAEGSVFPICGSLLLLLTCICCCGLTRLEPNEAKVMVFFGKYKGTFKKEGFSWVNPLMSKKGVNYRARNLNPEPIKVNDKVGNPVMIGIVLVWQLEDSYRAMFEIDSQALARSSASKKEELALPDISGAFEKFVRIQSDAALRQVAGCYAYDNPSSENELTLRSNADEINDSLVKLLNDRLSMAGMKVLEARINYLAYAPEIAAIMLRRQQADAIIAAREKIVEGAVSMVKMALDRLKTEEVVELDEERKAAMVGNLLVVLCGDEPASPVINSGSLY